MKKNLFLAAIFSLFVFAVTASAQIADHSGTWKLDVSKSKLGDRNMIAEQTLTVVQTAKDITVTPVTKRNPPPEGSMGGRSGGGGGMGGGGDAAMTYTLDGKETKAEVEGRMGKMPVTLSAKSEGGKLHLTSVSTFSGQMGEITVTTKESWEMSTDGKTLTITTDRTTPRGTDSTTRVFTKN